eukprot:650317-Prorocentrum_minimum.AAC.1
MVRTPAVYHPLQSPDGGWSGLPSVNIPSPLTRLVLIGGISLPPHAVGSHRRNIPSPLTRLALIGGISWIAFREYDGWGLHAFGGALNETSWCA